MRRALRRLLLTAALILSTVVVLDQPAYAAAPVSLTSAHWIWYPEGDPHVSVPAEYRYFRKTFTVAAGAVSDAQLVVTGDDTVDVWLNGKPLAGSPRATDAWKSALYVDLQAALVAGTNTLAVAVHNTTAGPAGLLGRVHVVTAGGTTDLVTDAGWKAGNSATAGWEQPGFADGGWPAGTDLGAYGVAPWLTNVAAPADPSTASSPLTVASATVEHRTNPLGVDAGKAPLRLAARLLPAPAAAGRVPDQCRHHRGRRRCVGQRPRRRPAVGRRAVQRAGADLDAPLLLAGPSVGQPGPARRLERQPNLRDRAGGGAPTSSAGPRPTWPVPTGSGTPRGPACRPPPGTSGARSRLAAAAGPGDARGHRRRHRRRVGQRGQRERLADGSPTRGSRRPAST